MTTPTLIHITVPGFSAITEFPSERPDIHDDCGPCANEVCIAACEGHVPSTGDMITIRNRDIQAGKFRVGGGQTLDELAWDVATHTAIQTTKTPLGSSVDAIHTALKAASLRGNPCVLNLALAGSLPGNEPGIHYHFVACGGIDTRLGYAIANGDEYPFGHIGVYWVKWADIEKAQPVGLLEYHMPTPHALPTPGPAKPIPTSPSDDHYKAALAQIQGIAAAALKG